MALDIVPITFAEANEFVKRNHRHHGKVIGHKFSIAVADVETGKIVGHFKAQFRPGMVAFVHDDKRVKLVDNLEQGGFVRFFNGYLSFVLLIRISS